mmetsp:Transcript_25711/g.71833  ORF Transcript_25711/g.71833 Transcript_25711/m.71833 type:complete len:204 (+) Transcript_25711:649-1260(+)
MPTAQPHHHPHQHRPATGSRRRANVRRPTASAELPPLPRVCVCSSPPARQAVLLEPATTRTGSPPCRRRERRRGTRGRRRPQLRRDRHPPGHRDHRVRFGYGFQHSFVPPSLGPVACSLRACHCLLGEGNAHHLEHELLRILHRIRSLRRSHLRCAADDGRPRMLPPRLASALGRIPKQVLQGRWCPLRPVQLQASHQGCFLI